MRYFRKTFVVISAIVVVIALILLVVSAIFFYGYKTQMSKLRASGRYSTLAGFQTPKVPADQNAATIYTELINRRVDRKLYADWSRLRKILYVTRSGANQDLWSEARAIVSRNRGICDQIGKAARKPYCVYPVDWSQDFPPRLFNYTNLLLFASEFYLARAILGAKDDRPGYPDSIHTCIVFGRLLADQPDSTTQLLVYVILETTCGTVLRTFDYREMEVDDLHSLYSALSQIDLTHGLELAFRREMLLALDSPPRIWSPEALVGEGGGGAVDAAKGMADSAFRVYYDHIGQYGDRSVWIGQMTRLIEGMDLTYSEALERDLIDPHIPSYAIMTYQLGSTYAKMNSQRYWLESKLAGTRTVLALHAYKNRYHSYPTDIAELRSKLAWKIPKDTYSDKEFIYRRQGKGFLLYSIGPDQKDDGSTDYRSKKRGIGDRLLGDIVWKADH